MLDKTSRPRRPSKRRNKALFDTGREPDVAALMREPKEEVGKTEHVLITPPRFDYAKVLIRGTAPLVICAFAQKAMNQIIETQKAGSQSRKGKKRDPKDFDEVYEGAQHISREGWHGFSAAAIRNAAISACRLVGYKMTIAKMSLFVLQDGFDRVYGIPLIRITKGKPTRNTMPARPNAGGVDIRVRPMWIEGWEAVLNLRWDADQFSASDTLNLITRVGMQVGIGEGRPDSPNSAGMGWGTFEIVG